MTCTSGVSTMGRRSSFLPLMFSSVYLYQYGFMGFYIFVGYNPLLIQFDAQIVTDLAAGTLSLRHVPIILQTPPYFLAKEKTFPAHLGHPLSQPFKLAFFPRSLPSVASGVSGHQDLVLGVVAAAVPLLLRLLSGCTEARREGRKRGREAQREAGGEEKGARHACIRISP